MDALVPMRRTGKILTNCKQPEQSSKWMTKIPERYWFDECFHPFCELFVWRSIQRDWPSSNQGIDGRTREPKPPPRLDDADGSFRQPQPKRPLSDNRCCNSFGDGGDDVAKLRRRDESGKLPLPQQHSLAVVVVVAVVAADDGGRSH